MAGWMNLGQNLKVNAKKFPTTVMLKDSQRNFTYPEVNERVNRLANSLLSLGLGFQPQLSGRDNARLSAMLQGATPSEADTFLEPIREFSELGGSFDEPVVTYSSGMQARLGFATALQTHHGHHGIYRCPRGWPQFAANAHRQARTKTGLKRQVNGTGIPERRDRVAAYLAVDE